MFDKQFNYNEITNTWTVNLKPRYDHALPDDDEMDEDNNNNSIIKNTGDINIDTTTYFQEQTQNITQNGDYIYEQNENGAWHLELKSQDSTEPTDVNINIPITNNTITNLTAKGYQQDENGYYIMASVPENINTYCKTIKQYITDIPTTIIDNWEDLVNNFGNMLLTGEYSYAIGTKYGRVCQNYVYYRHKGSIYLNDQNWTLATYSTGIQQCGQTNYIKIKYNSNNEYWSISLGSGFSEGDYYNVLPRVDSIESNYINIEYNNTTYTLNNSNSYIIYLKFHNSGTIEQIIPNEVTQNQSN